MAAKLTITHGIPGCGKSTWAQQVRAQDPETVIVVERDDIRTQLFGEDYHKGNPVKKLERQVTQVHDQLVEEGLRRGKHVIVANTHLNTQAMQAMRQEAQKHGADFAVKSFDVDPQECRRRNEARGAAGGRLVPAHVMDAMIEKAYGEDGHLKGPVFGERQVYLVERDTPGQQLLRTFNAQQAKREPLTGKAVVIVDIDGTLANNTHHARQFLHDRKKKDFTSFYKSILQAPVNESVRDLANTMRQEEGLNLVVLTGRDDSHARELLAFVERSGLRAHRVIAKRRGDFRPDGAFKHEVIQGLRQEGLIPVHALDDRESSIATMEAHGILVSRVATPEHNPALAPGQAYAEPAVDTVHGTGACLRCGKPLKRGSIGPACATKL